MVKDPICEMEVDKETVKHKAEYIGKTYYFCSAMCKEKFKEIPQKYVDK
jgi:Cu+-exporting ATPase